MNHVFEKMAVVAVKFFMLLFCLCVGLLSFQILFSEKAAASLIPFAGGTCILYLAACFFGEFLPRSKSSVETPKTSQVEAASPETLDPRCRTSYLKVISALCNIKREIDPSSREASGILASQSQRDNLTLSHSTIKNIFREVEEIRKNSKSK